MTELAAPQISSLMEALPGIAAVLRSPVANAMVAISRAAAGLEEFQLSHAEELPKFGVRRNLLTPEETDKVLDELREEVASKRPQKPVPPPVKKAAVIRSRRRRRRCPIARRGFSSSQCRSGPLPPPPPPPAPLKLKLQGSNARYPAGQEASAAPVPREEGGANQGSSCQAEAGGGEVAKASPPKPIKKPVPKKR